MSRPDRGRLADGLERLKERHRESLAPPEYAVLLRAVEVLRDEAGRPYRGSPKHAYLHDPTFHALVDMIEKFVAQGELTPVEVRQAATLACVHHEMRRGAQPVAGLGDDWERSRDRPSVDEAWEDAERSDHPAAIALEDLRQRMKALEDLHFSPEDGGSP